MYKENVWFMTNVSLLCVPRMGALPQGPGYPSLIDVVCLSHVLLRLVTCELNCEGLSTPGPGPQSFSIESSAVINSSVYTPLDPCSIAPVELLQASRV